ncbi:MAG TPA: cytochrome P450 [Acidimicrobiales bacterium]|jgi:cytochrome P450|nr:cytochrome P450 [Acidimicrobiales bacterium]
MSADASGEIYYDPYDFEIDANPYPVWKRLRDEAPLYWNEKYQFFALSRFADIDAAMLDWGTYISGRGSILEIIQANIELPPGIILMEDPPVHTMHRSLLSRVFTPKKMQALEGEVRAYCAEVLDPLVGQGGFDFIADLGAFMPMRTIGMLLGIPEEDQVAIREQIDQSLRLEEGAPPATIDAMAQASVFGDYIDWRADHPSDDLMTELMTSEFEDETGTRRTLHRDEVLTYVMLIAGAGNETTARLIGFTGQLLSDHPDQLRELAADRSLVNNAIEEILRYESPSPVQARYVTRDVELHDQKVPEGSVMVLLNGSGNRDDRHFENGDSFDIHREVGRHLAFGYGIHLCLGAALARLEGRIALEEVLQRFPRWEVDYDRARRAKTSTVRGWETLPVRTA